MTTAIATLPEPVAAALRRFALEQRDAEGRVTWPGLSREALTALRDGLTNDDPAIVQHHTALCGSVSIPPKTDAWGLYGWDYECVGGCLMGYPIWKGGEAGTRTVREKCQSVYVAANLGPLVTWFDSTPRAESFPLLAAECDTILAEAAA